MSILIAHSSLPNMDEALRDLAGQLKENQPRLVVYFASPLYPIDLLSKRMKEQFPGSQVMGCTTSGEIISGKMLDQSIVVMSIGNDILEDCAIALIEDVNDAASVAGSVKQLADYYKKPLMDLEFEQHGGIILIDGLSCAEEKVMDQIGDLSNLLIVGASAGDDLKFEKTWVAANGKACSNAAVLAVFKSKRVFDVLKTQSFCPLKQVLTATKVNEKTRTVLEFNNQPALDAYAASLGVSPDEASQRFMHNPVGLMVNNEPYVRSPQKNDGKNMVFYCNILEGMEVAILESGDIVMDTQQAINKQIEKLGPIEGMINFNCILRTLELKQQNQQDAYGSLFSAIPTIGFSTYGEEFMGHINQTSTILVFHKKEIN